MTPFEIILIILIILFVGGIIAWRAVVHVRKKQGKSGGGCCDCAGCPASGSCPSVKAKKPFAEEIDEQMPEITVQSEVTCDFSDITASTDNK